MVAVLILESVPLPLSVLVLELLQLLESSDQTPVELVDDWPGEEINWKIFRLGDSLSLTSLTSSFFPGLSGISGLSAILEHRPC